jgi:hypothetical protein
MYDVTLRHVIDAVKKQEVLHICVCECARIALLLLPSVASLAVPHLSTHLINCTIFGKR